MTENTAPGSDSRKGSWLLWTGTVVAMATLAFAMRLGAEAARMQAEILAQGEKPAGPKTAWTAASFLWIAVLVAAAAGIPAVRTSRRATLMWSMLTMLAILGATGLIAVGLTAPA
jgi:hypothetical protein